MGAPEVKGKVSAVYKDFAGEACYMKVCVKCNAQFATYEPLRELCHDCLP